MSDPTTTGCSCGCGVTTMVTEAEETCGCGCACCGSPPRSRDQEIAELRQLKEQVERRLDELESGESQPRNV